MVAVTHTPHTTVHQDPKDLSLGLKADQKLGTGQKDPAGDKWNQKRVVAPSEDVQVTLGKRKHDTVAYYTANGLVFAHEDPATGERTLTRPTKSEIEAQKAYKAQEQKLHGMAEAPPIKKHRA